MNEELEVLTPLEVLKNIQGSLDSYCIQYWDDKELKQAMMKAHTEQCKLIEKEIKEGEEAKKIISLIKKHTEVRVKFETGISYEDYNLILEAFTKL